MHFLYILYLKQTNQLYTGTTGNIKRRIAEHKQGKTHSTKNKTPSLIHCEIFTLKSDAERRERFLKTTEGKRLLRQQIKDILKQHNYPTP